MTLPTRTRAAKAGDQADAARRETAAMKRSACADWRLSGKVDAGASVG
jgi:hypothetical protein